jgi:alpha-L-fucosidase
MKSKQLLVTTSLILLIAAIAVQRGSAQAIQAPSKGDQTTQNKAAQAELVKAVQEDFLTWHFGMFLHFNMATFADVEWATGHEDPALFRPEKLDCGQWADAAKDAQMKYAVLTIKHTGGWCLWNSKHTTHDMKAFKNYKNGKGDIVRAFTDAFRAKGLKVGLYYCFPGDYSGGPARLAGRPDLHGLPPEATGNYLGFIKKQITELLTNFGPIDLLWCDQYSNPYTGDGWQEVRALVKSLQPRCLVVANNAHNLKDTDIYSHEYPYWCEVKRPDRALPSKNNTTASEVCDKLGDGWFWHPNPKNPQPAKQIVELLRTCNARHANYLLNVPVNRDGVIADPYLQRMREIGRELSNLNTK